MWLILKLDHFNDEKRRVIYQKTTSKPVFSLCNSAFFVCLIFFSKIHAQSTFARFTKGCSIYYLGANSLNQFLNLGPNWTFFLFITILFRTYICTHFISPLGIWSPVPWHPEDRKQMLFWWDHDTLHSLDLSTIVIVL